MTIHCQLDHLVVLAQSLEQAAQWASTTLGVRPTAGGKHALMGTHNLLLRIGPSAYLEFIAIDPDAPAPKRPRWFEMDSARRQTSVRHAPTLLTFVARTVNLDATMELAGENFGTALPLERGDFRWRITVPDDGALREAGLLPTLIEWSTPSPAASLPPSGIELERISAHHPHPRHLQSLYRSIGLDIEIEHGLSPLLRAVLRTPLGRVTLDSVSVN